MCRIDSPILGIVVGTGMSTQVGEIAAQISKTKLKSKTALQKK
jgi:hypothetical protein